MKLNKHRFMNWNEFLPSPTRNFFQKGKMIKLAKSLMAILIAATFAVSGCMQQESNDASSSSEKTIIEVNLGGASRAERFMGSYDEITQLKLDVIRNYGQKIVESGYPMDNSTGIWRAEVPNMIVGFDYTIKAHAYRNYRSTGPDNDSWYGDGGSGLVEIFQGETQLTVVEGINPLVMRLSPILDNRSLTIPRITRIERPFQLETEELGDIRVDVDTVGDGQNTQDGLISYRFRAVDNESLPVNDIQNHGTFSVKEGTLSGVTKNIKGYIDTIFTAPDNNSPCFDYGDVDGQCPQDIQIRVSNLQEIGVSAHFTI